MAEKTADVIRTGRVSSIDYENGTYEVTYSDREGSVTAMLPAIANNEYNMPHVGDWVLVTHLSNGTSAGVAIGTMWNEGNKPVEGFKGLYRKEFGQEPGVAFLRYDSTSGEFSIEANGAKIFIGAMGELEIESPTAIRITAPTVEVIQTDNNSGSGD